MKVNDIGLLIMAALLAGICAIAGCFLKPPTSPGPLRHEVYIWQRSWNDGVNAALAPAAARAVGFTALASEVSWDAGSFKAVKVPLDYAALRAADRPVGLALRIGPFPGPFTSNDETISRISALASEIVSEADRAGLKPVELQLDFDCADGKLAGYRLWVEAIKKRIAPTPVVVTTLPSWLDRPEFKALAKSSAGFVLQVHSLESPTGPDTTYILCDPTRSRRWIEKADKLGIPFRVALPTYGYLMGFDAGGKLTGLAAEGPAPPWPPGTVIREVRSDPVAIAGLVQDLTRDRPAHLVGIIWYRLPVAGDRLNWPWATLAAVMDGRPPRSRLAAKAQKAGDSLVDIVLRNDGETEEPMADVVIDWKGSELIAGDGLGGYAVVRTAEGAALRRESRPGNPLISPGESRPVGWLRFERETEVKTYVEPQMP